MPFRIPRFLQGNPHVHNAFWAFGIYANNHEEAVVKAWDAYDKNPTPDNRKAYETAAYWAQEWAENVGEHTETIFILPLAPDSQYREQNEIIPKLKEAMRKLNPYEEESNAAFQRYAENRTEENYKEMKRIGQMWHTVAYDWNVELGFYPSDDRGKDPRLDPRPAHVPRYTFPKDEAMKMVMGG